MSSAALPDTDPATPAELAYLRLTLAEQAVREAELAYLTALTERVAARIRLYAARAAAEREGQISQ